MPKIELMRRVLASNDALAAAQRKELDRHGVLGINIMSGPGAGKTSLVERTAEALSRKYRIQVIEGDIQGDLDARRVAAKGVRCIQINTQGACHLDGLMLGPAMGEIDFADLDLLLIENVGNLVCPAEFMLPVHYNVTVISTPEGSDKPVKYQLMFSKSDVIVINKIDLLPHVDFDVAALKKAVRKLRPGITFIEMSAKTGKGVDKWVAWLERRLRDRRKSR
ncbi:MAG: hydrogenase nickel incorporation protein HypB [candidate division WOR-3 bacterium]|nr:hydrogenase nickel incorporation protein HypB [candidate division WOR-3 bacterium]